MSTETGLAWLTWGEDVTIVIITNVAKVRLEHWRVVIIIALCRLVPRAFVCTRRRCLLLGSPLSCGSLGVGALAPTLDVSCHGGRWGSMLMVMGDGQWMEDR